MRTLVNLGGIFFGVAILTACQRHEEATPVAPRPVLSLVAKQTSVTSLRLTGTIEPKVKTELGFRVLGRIIARNVDVGDLVEKGKVVASIDPLALELAVKSAQSDLANAQAKLTNAIATEQRQRALAEARSGTEAALEEAEQGRKTANANVGKSQASLDKAEEQLGYAQLHAEFDGVVTAISAEVGQVVSAGKTVITIARPEERDAVIDVPQAAAQNLEIGASFEVSLQLDPAIRTRGIVREIAPAAEAATRTRRTKIGLIEPPAAFRLGSIITATAITPSEFEILLPASAILQKDGSTSVWLVNSQAKKVELRPVTVLGDVVDGGTVRLTSGIVSGDRVVVAGVHSLTDGQTIRIDQEVNQ